MSDFVINVFGFNLKYCYGSFELLRLKKYV